MTISDPHHPRAAGNVEWYEEQMKEQGNAKLIDNAVIPPLTNERPTDYGYSIERDSYEALCRGETHEVRCHCRYW